MRSRLVDLESTTAALRPYLDQYLKDNGIDTSKNFKCLNPKHNDGSPSMTCKQDNQNAFCYGCGMTADIFAAATALEGKPASGLGFVEDNVMYLAKRYGVDVKLQDLTEEEIREYRTYQAYRLAADLVADPTFGDYSIVDPEIDRRKWDKQKLVNWGIGTVNHEDFKDRLKKAGYDVKFLASIDLDRENLFNSNNLLFTVCDDRGRPVGFSAKNLKHNGDDKYSGPKYINTRGTGLECAIFKKGERLYGFDIALSMPEPLYIFEGQADVITARHHGLMNCCCTMGTALTDYHVNLLKRHGRFNIILVFDGDEAGQLAVEKALDEKFAKEKDFRVKLCQLPKGQDPDDLLRAHGFSEFARLKKWSAFEWRIAQFLTQIDGDITDELRREIAEKMTPIIVAEKSHIQQEDMAKQVAKMTGYDLSTIISEVKRQRSEKEAEIQSRKKNAIEALLSEVKYHPDNAEIALVQCQSAIADINKSLQIEGESGSVLSSVLSLKEYDENKSPDFSGFFMKPDGLGCIAARLNDDWKKDTLFFIGGGSQASKTTMCCQMAYEIADDSRNNAICIYHSIDDSARFIIYKWVCNAAEEMNLELNAVSNPNYWTNQPGYENIKEIRQTAYSKIIKMVQNGQLVVKDASDGNGLAYTESLIKYYRDLYPEKNIVLFLDNFHKLPDSPETQGHERVKRLSNQLKNMTVRHHCTIVSTVEYRKLAQGEKPTNLAIAESRALDYDASIICHLYNDLHNTSETEAALIHYGEDGTVLPRIWCKFGKNKVSGYIGREFLDLHPSHARMKAVSLEVAEKEQRERLLYLKENKDIVM